MGSDWQGALARARAESPFLARALERHPELADLLSQGDADAALEYSYAAGENAADLAAALRRERLALSAALAIGDLAGHFHVDKVMAELSALADRSLDQAITHSILRRVEDAEPRGMIALALGKHGANELNYSSDIDPILLYEPETLPRRSRDEPGEAAQRYARELVRLLSENNEEGYVFRVDLRLRPASEVSPLAISTDAALTHYESSALAWERAAFIRARAAAGDIAAGEEFLTAIKPFVWRSSLDFGAIDEIRQLTTRIRANYSGPAEPGHGYNLKHGRGGIREIEFFAQTHQLIHGGRDASLRLRGTRDALNALAKAGRISDEDAGDLGNAYDSLRVIEHRLQMVNDRQTHSLPEGEALDGVARLHGLADGVALVRELNAITGRVAAAYDRLIGEDGENSPSKMSAAQIDVQLDDLGLTNARATSARIDGWRDGRYQSLRSPAALAAFDAMLPSLVSALALADDPDRVMLQWEGLLANASSAINLFRLLEARPALFEQLLAILTLAPTLAEELGRRPELLDTLIDRSALDLPGSVEEIEMRMAPASVMGDYERLLDRIRLSTGELRFTLGLQLIEAAQDPLDVAAALSRAAEAALNVAHCATCEEFASKHGRIKDSEMLVLGLGRLGGGALTHESDLDLIYLFTGETGSESDGERSLSGSHYYNRLAQRLSAALSVPTAQGALYDVDTRLRPQGAQGPLVVTCESFAKYQKEAAWTWEHMALTRARVLIGSDKAKADLERIIAEVLNLPREEAKLREDVLKMRDEMAQHKSAKGPLDAKLQRGGLVDLEFLVHYLQLRDHRALLPNLREAISDLARSGLLPDQMTEAHDLMTRLLVSARLLAPDVGIPPRAASQALAKACKTSDLAQLRAEFLRARQLVAASWDEIFELKLEIEE